MSSLSGLSLKSRRILPFTQASSSHFNPSLKPPEFAALEIQGTEDLEFGRVSAEIDAERGAGCFRLKG